jgi:hypothetical protein
MLWINNGIEQPLVFPLDVCVTASRSVRAACISMHVRIKSGHLTRFSRSWESWVPQFQDYVQKRLEWGYAEIGHRFELMLMCRLFFNWLLQSLCGLFAFLNGLLDLRIETFGRTPWRADQSNARPLPTQDNTPQKDADTHPCAGQDSNLRSQCSSGRRQYMP